MLLHTYLLRDKLFGLIFCLFCLSFPLASQTIVFLEANVIDGTADEVIPNVSVLVDNGKIQAIGNEDMTIPQNAKVVNLKGRYLMPGMIDAHVHIRSFAAATTALHSGVTTVRSMGVPHFVDVGMRELAKSGELEAQDNPQPKTQEPLNQGS